MKQARGAFLTILILVLVGCDHDDDDILIEEQQEQLKELENQIVELEDTIKEQQKIIDEQNEEFSYLKEFTKKELDTYNKFTQDKDSQHLLGFSPEKIFLIYYHSVVINDVEAIYSLTYNDGTLPDLTTFRQEYYNEGLNYSELENTLKFRDYIFIKAREENKTENEVFVELNVGFGNYQSAIIYGLKKENEIWKMDILHLMEYLKEKNKKIEDFGG